MNVRVTKLKTFPQYEWKIHQLLQQAMLVPAVKTLSLDCFDTLFVRDAISPSNLFARIPGFLPATAPAGRLHIAPARFAAIRKAAEERAREIKRAATGVSDEVTLREIYQELPAYFRRLHAIEVWIKAEQAAEEEALAPYPQIVELARQALSARKKLIIVSDSYHDPAWLKNFIRRKTGLNQFRLFVSSAYQTGKAGRLFDEVLAELKLAPGSVLHVGDNYEADHASPLRRGMKTFFLPHGSSEIFAQVEREIGVFSASSDDHRYIYRDHYLTAARAKLATRHVYDKKKTHRYLGATLLGPIALAFSLWALTKVRESGAVARVVCLGREGAVIHKWLKYLQPLQTELLFLPISRRSLIAAGIETVSEATLREALHSFREVKRGEFLHMLGLSDEDVRPYLPPARDMGWDSLLRTLVDTPKLSRKILRHCQQQHRNLLTALERFVRPARGSIVCHVVDVGWNASIQARLQRLLESRWSDVHLQGLYMGLFAASNERLHHAGPAQGFLFDTDVNDPVYRMAPGILEILEQCLSHQSLSVARYGEQGEPIYSISSVSTEQQQQACQLQTGIMDFIAEWNSFGAPREYSDNLLQYARKILLAGFVFPDGPLQLLFGHWSHDDNLVDHRQGSLSADDVVAMADYMPLGELLHWAQRQSINLFPYFQDKPVQQASLYAVMNGLRKAEDFAVHPACSCQLFHAAGTEPFTAQRMQQVPLAMNDSSRFLVRIGIDTPGGGQLRLDPVDRKSLLRLDRFRISYQTPQGKAEVHYDREELLLKMRLGSTHHLKGDWFLLGADPQWIWSLPKLPEQISSVEICLMGACYFL